MEKFQSSSAAKLIDKMGKEEIFTVDALQTLTEEDDPIAFVQSLASLINDQPCSVLKFAKLTDEKLYEDLQGFTKGSEYDSRE